MVDTQRGAYEIRPRLVWGGLAVALLGMAGLAVGFADASWAWSALGVLVMLAGVAIGIRGGGLHETRRPGRIGEEMAEVAHGRPWTRQRTEPDEHQRRAALETGRRRRWLLSRAERTPGSPLAPGAATGLVLLGGLMLVAQGPLYPMSHTGEEGSWRALACGIVFTLGGLRLVFGGPGRHLPTIAVVTVAACALFLGAVLLHHQSRTAGVVEAAVAVLAVLAALVCLVSPRGSGRSEPDR